ncbi:DUF192 domain-containing protein [Desulfosporosinus sp.]|uniref:DUF192 domain-containing protein n=1 Tax=Desulfosporosinus sp. TaxID=157907 RepID=UPI000E9EC776|nr:DUF192 domain-containing protein [Desulfosporosinus sp.]MBC2723300.1 DUF192 domain-containing protein [Desulfosporosinus sp.]HBV86980.1 DUF192 domain-containing protein [Desulfosporosinus sp.]
MNYGQMRNLRTGQVIAEQVWIADSYWTRLLGLLGRSELAPSKGLWIKPCRQVHMIGMRFSISVWYLDKSGQVCGIIDELHPWKVSPYMRKALSILELPVGWGEATNTVLGDKLVWEENPVGNP